ncbi:MAG: hypothetical protein LBK75_06340, partial [Oscillospiraceae bacterium]|nr:hypothetical protein [Oscillospiraceae bacterium]
MKRIIATLLIAMTVLTMLPPGAFAFGLREAEGVKSGVYTAGDGAVYTILYNDYITLYVNTLDGGFAVLPATESFDSAKPLSHATFRIDGEAYDYGAYYSGMSGAVGIAPQTSENGILESHWQIGDFIVSQYFAVTSDTEHSNSYAVKVGYSAQYFGEGAANIAGRILLDTQFTPDESVPVMLLDGEDNAALIESAAALNAVPASAFVSKEFIEESNLESESPVFADSPNKGYLLFDDTAFAAPDGVTFAAFDEACDADYDYTPADIALFDGSGADSAALLYWSEVSVSQGNQATFGTNYGFYDLKRGDPHFDPAPELTSESATFALLSEGVQSATVIINRLNAPESWFSMNASVSLSDTTAEYDEYVTYLQGIVTAAADLTIQLAYKPDTPQIIQDGVRKVMIEAHWDGGGEDWSWSNYELIEGEMIEREEILIGSSATIPMAEAFTHRKADEDLSIAIIPIVEAPAGYAYVTLNTAGSLNGATVSLSGSDVTEYYDSVFYGRYYFAKQSSTAKLNMEMESLAYGPWSAEGYPSIRWDYGEPTTLTAGGGDLAGPLNYTYTFTVPNNAETGAIAAGITTVSTEPNPVNIKAYSTSYTVQTVETALWGAISGVSEGGGLKWATPSTTVTVNSSALSSYSGYKLYVYKAGTKTSALTGNETGEITNTNSFTMPGEPVDLVYEQGNNYRVLTTVSGEGTATVVVDSAHGSRPQSGDEVYVYMTNIEGGYSLEKVEATGATLAAQAGGAHKFTMPADSDVTVTATLESSDDVSAEMHSITVKPLAGDGMLRFDVAFWTDTASGARKLYEVDEAGRLGRVRTGTTVYYALYPTTWAIDTNSLSDMDNWVVSGLTMNGVTPEGFTEITGPGYFPTSYNPSNANSTAGTFTMPDEDVILELTGYKKTKVYSLTLEAYDEYGNRLSLPENTVRSAAVDPTKVYDSTNFTAPPWNEGLNVEAFMDKFLRLEAPQQFDRYTLESAAVMTGGATTMALTPLGGTWQADWPVSGLVARYYFQPMFQNNAIVRLTYAVKYNRLNITGFEPQEWNVYRPGEVRVYEGSGRSETRALNVLRDGEGKGAIELTLDWSRMGDGIDYMLPASGDGFTTSFLHSKGGSATYSVTVTKPEATIAIQEKPVAPSLGLSDGVSFNSANSNTFKTVNLHAGYYKLDADGKSGYSENLKNLLNGNPAPKITEMTLASEKTQEGFPKNVTGDVYANNNAAFSWPQNEFRDDFTGARNGQLMALDLRSLFGIDGEYSFPEGNYTLTVKWSYGDGLRESGEKSYTFYLSPTIYAPGELTHIGIVKVDHIYPEDMRAHPGIERGNWIVVTGVSNEDMMKTAGRISDSPPLLTFVNDSSNGFFVGYEDHDYWAQGTIVMNGHAYFKNLPSGAGEFYIDEDNGSVTIESYEMTFGGKIIPVWLPIQIGSNNGVRFGTNTLKIDIEKYKNYTIPYEIPEYHKGNAANAEDAKAKWQAEVDALRENTVTIYPDLEGAAWSGGNQVESGDPDDIPAELRWTGNSVALKIGDYELEGLTADYREIYLLGHGFDIGGQINVQIPGTKDPIFRVELVSLVTDNTARLIPIDNVWAEGEGTVKLPDAIGGYGGQASGVFNTFTQDFGFEAMINFKVIELAGELYLARSERFKIPVLDRYVVSIGLDGLGVGAGLPPVPVQIIEINGIKVGVTNLADTFDYDPRKNTIPSMRIIIGGKFKLVEVLGFEAEMWSEMFSGGFSVEGNLEIGPFSFPLIKELSLEYGMKDGPFEEYEDAGTIVKGKRSLLFFINAKCHVSLLGIVDGAGGFSVNMTISPFLWEKRGGFKSVQEVFDFLKFSITANGYLYASLNVPLTDWTIADADVRVDIV